MKRVGIFSGTFDPIHAGHVAFALKALERFGLDKVVFIPEAVPRRKEGVTHYAHRVAMIKLALIPHNKLSILELPDKQFSVQKTLPRLRKIYANDELYMLMGSDMVDLIISKEASKQWPGIGQLLSTIKIIVAVREKRITEEHRHKIDLLQPGARILASTKPHASSADIRQALLSGKKHKDVLPSIQNYISNNWLYTSVAGAASSANNS
jgi:nicotinate-nucleotide adenylyltransferase